ncbi:MAG TPA: CheR family methyltransferase, partial [Planctomycetaceae bacterium]|nr:CheR family methyltransferase [Planctomycetaceae bacterium]
VVPDLVAKSEQTGTIRVWVPACATGEEAYSLAMLIFDRLQAERRSPDVKVFATDVDESAIRIGRAAIFPDAIADDVPDDALRRYFVRGDHGYQIAKPLRDAVVFAIQNVLDDPPFSRLDLISCRNLLIYLQPEAQQRLISLFHFALREGGWLFLGKSETIGAASELFARVGKQERIYRRIGPTRHDLVEFAPGRPRAAGRDPRVGRWADQAIVRQYAPACVLINLEFDVLYFSGPTQAYLNQPVGEPTRNLLSLAGDELAATLRVVVRQAVETGRSAAAQGTMKRDGGTFAVRCAAVPLQSPHEAQGLLLVSFEDAARLPAEAPPSDETRVMHLEQELLLARGDLTAALDQFETSGEEHQAVVEEIRSMNEELQSMNEDLETSKEELESLTEELTSVNQQLEGNVAKLEAVSDDLSNLLRSTEIATVFLDRTLCIRRFTPAVRKLLNLIPGDVGRPLSDIARNFTDESLLRDVQAVLDHLTPREAEVSTPDVNWYIRRVLPFCTEDDHVGGVVITFTDITARKRAEQELSALARSLERKVDQRTRCVRLLQDVAVIANEAESLSEALLLTLKRVCTLVGWPAGHAFLAEEDDGEVFVDTGLWHLESPDALAGLVAASRAAHFRRGEGTIGRVAETARPVLVRDVRHDTSFLRAKAVGGSIRAAYAFPILNRSQVVGVIEFFTSNDAEPDPELVDGLREIGTQLGRVVERRQLQREVAEATAHEQRFVGQELHDTISQDITGIAMLLGRVRQELEASGSPLAEKTAALEQHLETARQHVRQLAHGLMPVEIESGGLAAALKALAATARELHDVECTFHCETDCQVESSTVAMHLYRIAQEAQQNALRHGHAPRIEIVLSRRDQAGTITIRDNGTGFDPAALPPGGIGTQIMRYRASLVGAKLEIRSRTGEGTQVTCTFPCAE